MKMLTALLLSAVIMAVFINHKRITRSVRRLMQIVWLRTGSGGVSVFRGTLIRNGGTKNGRCVVMRTLRDPQLWMDNGNVSYKE